MRTEWKLFLGLGIFMLPLGIVYWVLTALYGGLEIAGSLLLIIVALAFAFVGVYLLIQSKRLGGARPEDRDADPSEGAGSVGSFPVSSVWPLIGAIGALMLAYGLIFGIYLAIPGLLIIVTTVIGFARESEISGLHMENLSAAPGVDPEPTFSDQVKK
jgi:hypothetical protein